MKRSKHTCPECGMTLGDIGVTRCPKCDCDVYAVGRNELLEVDVVHGGEDWPEAQRKIQNAMHATTGEAYTLKQLFNY